MRSGHSWPLPAERMQPAFECSARRAGRLRSPAGGSGGGRLRTPMRRSHFTREAAIACAMSPPVPTDGHSLVGGASRGLVGVTLMLACSGLGCAANWHDMNTHTSAAPTGAVTVSAHDDSLYRRFSQMPLDSLTARQYDWLIHERARRE